MTQHVKLLLMAPTCIQYCPTASVSMLQLYKYHFFRIKTKLCTRMYSQRDNYIHQQCFLYSAHNFPDYRHCLLALNTKSTMPLSN